jgi:glycosyltransferase involved in cell wall biosynthesis
VALVTVIAITRVKDEADVIGPVVEHMLGQVDHVIVEDNGSTDGTLEILAGLDVEVLHDETLGYYQSAAMSRLTDYARRQGATWVIPFDADEVWLSRDGRRIADVLTGLPESVLVAQADLWDHVSTAHDPDDANPLRRIGWRRSYAASLPKVAIRPVPDVVIAQGNHSARFGHTEHPATLSNLLTIRHYAYRSAAQAIRKIRNGAAAYAATDLPEGMGAHWRQWGAFSDEQIEELYAKWHWQARPGERLTIDGEMQPALVYDPAPIACPSPS